MSAALSFRRWALIVLPLAAAALIVAGVFLDPDIDADGRELAEQYANNEERTQLSALAFHFAFIMTAPIVFALVGLVRGRGAWLANVAAILATLGATTLPGFLLVDFYDIAIYDAAGPAVWQEVTDRLEELPGAMVLFLTAFLGHVLCLPIALVAAWRAGRLALWVPVVVVGGSIAAQFAPRVAGIGLLLAAASMLALSYAFWHIDRPGREVAAL